MIRSSIAFSAAIRRNPVLYRIARRFLGAWRRYRYRLSNVASTFYPGKGCHIARDLVAGEYSYIGPQCIIGPKVQIGAYVMFGPRVCVIGDDHRFDIVGQAMVFAGRPDLRPTKIGRDVWIGANSVIMSGVSIGDGAIVAAGTVVTKNIPSFEIHGGVPNRKLRNRFSSDSDIEKHRLFLARPPKEGDYCEWRY